MPHCGAREIFTFRKSPELDTGCLLKRANSSSDDKQFVFSIDERNQDYNLTNILKILEYVLKTEDLNHNKIYQLFYLIYFIDNEREFKIKLDIYIKQQHLANFHTLIQDI